MYRAMNDLTSKKLVVAQIFEETFSKIVTELLSAQQQIFIPEEVNKI